MIFFNKLSIWWLAWTRSAYVESHQLLKTVVSEAFKMCISFAVMTYSTTADLWLSILSNIQGRNFVTDLWISELLQFLSNRLIYSSKVLQLLQQKSSLPRNPALINGRLPWILSARKNKLQSWVIKGHYVVLKKKKSNAGQKSPAALNSNEFFWVCVWTQLDTYSKFIFHGIFKRHKMYGSGVGSRFCIHQYFQERAFSIGVISTTKCKTGSRCFRSVVLWRLHV